MIPKMETGTFYIQTESSEYGQLGKSIEMAEISSPDEPIADPQISTFDRNRGFTGTFQLEGDLTATDIYLVLHGVLTIQQVSCNNWRRFHGMPLKKRRYLRKKK